MPTLTEVRTLAMKLPKASRLRLASDLFDSSSDQLVRSDAEEILAEAGRRDADIESGEVAAISLKQFMDKTGARRSRLAKA